MVPGVKYNALLLELEDLKQQNEKLKSDLNYQVNQKFEHFIENQQLKKEIINLKTEIVDHRTKEYRLLKILNETSDYTE